MSSSQPPLFAKAKFSYKGTYPEDLVFTKGSILHVLSVVTEGEWWKARKLAEDGTEMEGEEGNVPMAYLTILDNYTPSPTPAVPSPGPPPPVPLASRPKTSPALSTPEPSDVDSQTPFSALQSSLSPPIRLVQPKPSTLAPERALATSLHFPSPASAPPSRNWTPPSRASSSASASASSPSTAPTSEAKEEEEVVFTSLKDRMAALNGRGLSVAGAPSSSASSRPTIASRPSVRATPSPSPPQPSPPLSVDLFPVPPTLKPRPKLPPSSSSTSSSERVGRPPLNAARPPRSEPEESSTPSPPPPRLPPRLPPRRPSSNVEHPAEESSQPPPPPPLARRFPPTVPRAVSTDVATLVTPSLPSRILFPAAGPTASSSFSKPPPPPRRQSNLPPPAAMPKPPPRPALPPPLTSTSIYSDPNAQQLTDEELGLASGWFARNPLVFPSSIPAKRNARPAASASQTSGGRAGTLKLELKYGDRSRSLVEISWGDGISVSSPVVKQTHWDPPRRRTAEELEEASACYGERIARWCEEHEGMQVGRGECWDLADQAIKEVTIQLKDETRGEFPGLCEAIEHAFGEVQYVNIDGDIGWGIERKVRRGDVLQFVTSTFKTMYSDGTTSTMTAGAPDHTAVVVEDWTGVGGAPIKCLHSNEGGSPLTRRAEFQLGDLVSGQVRAFRVLDEDWEWGEERRGE